MMVDRSMAIEAMVEIVGRNGVISDAPEMGAYTEDWRGRVQGTALCVVLPSTTAQLSEVVKICLRERRSIVPQGGNTGLTAGSVPPEGDRHSVIISLRRMNAIRSLDPANNTITVEAGCVLASVQDAAAEAGRLFPVSLGAEGSCMIGGNVGTNAGGTSCLRYGNMRENVLGLEVVLADGSIWNGLNGLRKNNSGYDFKHLFIGSEGTLGIVTAAVLKLYQLPTAQAMAWIAVDGPGPALELLQLFRASSEAQLSAFELLNETQVKLIAENVPGRRCPLDRLETWHLIVELSDTGEEASLRERLEQVLSTAFDRGLASDAVIAANQSQRDAIWAFRHAAAEGNRKGGMGVTSDTSVPISLVPVFIEQATEATHAIVPDVPIAVTVHLGDGNVHFVAFFTHTDWDRLADRTEIAARIRAAMSSVAMRLGGSFSAEHGIGRTFVAQMKDYKPPIELSIMRSIKAALDPSGLFNPGVLLPGGPLFGTH